MGLGLSPAHELNEFLSEMGVVFLLFFVGMEVSVERLIKGWRISVIGTLFQILLSVGFAWLLGWWNAWNVGEIILIGFIISLSSTAVVLTVLQNWNELHTPVGGDVLGILLVQDLMVVPMLIILGLLGGEAPTAFSIGLQVLGGLLILVLISYVVIKGKVKVRTPKVVEDDEELELYLSLAICLGLAILTTVFGLSEALGAFAAGIFCFGSRMDGPASPIAAPLQDPFHGPLLCFHRDVGQPSLHSGTLGQNHFFSFIDIDREYRH